MFGRTLLPERQSDESFEAYKARRKSGHRLVKALTDVRAGKTTAREQQRQALRESGRMKFVAGSYGKGLRNWINSKNRAAVASVGGKAELAVAGQITTLSSHS